MEGEVAGGGKISYNTETELAASFLEWKSQMFSTGIGIVLMGVPVKAEKLSDLEKLLRKLFGASWRNGEEPEWYAKRRWFY